MTTEHSCAAPLKNGQRFEQLRPALLVGAGGTIGSAIRFLLIEAFPSVDSFALSLLLINSGGAFLLGLLISFLAQENGQNERKRSARLFYGTGMLGGFTSYSALAAATGATLMDGAIAASFLYGFGTVILGLACAGFGLLAGQRIRYKREVN